jgi:hypothetical protein
MDLGTQMIAWSDPFCHALAAGGYQVVPFDNRHVGVILESPEYAINWAETHPPTSASNEALNAQFQMCLTPKSEPCGPDISLFRHWEVCLEIKAP